MHIHILSPPPNASNLRFASSYFQVLAELQHEFVTSKQRGLKKRVWIRRNVELRQYGFTDGCPGCEAAAKGAQTIGHSDVCRERIEAKMLEDETSAARVWRARERRGETPNVESASSASPSSGEQTHGDKRQRTGLDGRVRRLRPTK